MPPYASRPRPKNLPLFAYSAREHQTQDFVLKTYRLSKYFDWHEVRCKHCHKLPGMDVLASSPFRALTRLADDIREELQRELVVSSWYRCYSHPLESIKEKPGAHTYGLAMDFLMSGSEPLRALEIIQSHHGELIRCRYGIGLRQKGPFERRFMHLDIAGNFHRWREVRPWVWTY